MFFKRSRVRVRKPQMEVAMDMLMDSMIITYGYMKNKNYVLNEDDLKMVDLFVEELHRHYCTTGLIALSLHQRSRGEPEGSPLH